MALVLGLFTLSFCFLGMVCAFASMSAFAFSQVKLNEAIENQEW